MNGSERFAQRQFLRQPHNWQGQQTFQGGLVGNIGPGKLYHVDPTDGTSGATGLSWSSAMKGIDDAYTACVSGRGDVILVASRGTTSAGTSTYLTAALTWSKHGITVIGLCAPTISPRCRLVNATASLTLANILTVSGNNNAFYNLQIANFGSDAGCLNALAVTGERNYFANCHIAGMGHTAPGAVAAACSLLVNGGMECRFDNCIIGLDTVTRAAANAEINFDGGAGRIEFIGCKILSMSSTAGHGAIKSVDAGSISRSVTFFGCRMSCFKPSVPGACTVAIIGTAPNTGGIIEIMSCRSMGYAAWAAANDAYYIDNGADSVDSGGIAAVQA